MKIRIFLWMLIVPLMIQGCGGGDKDVVIDEPPSQAELQSLAAGTNKGLANADKLQKTCLCPNCHLAKLDLSNFRPADYSKFAARKVGQHFVQTICDLQHANLEGANMSHSNYSAKTTNYCTVKEELGCDSHIVATRFQLANMTGANLSHSMLINVTFNQANLSKANLADCDVTRSHFAHTKLTEANMENIKAYEDEVLGLQADFRFANIERANLKNAHLIALFTRADFRGADLQGAYLNADPTVSGGLLPWQRVNFSEANLKGAMIGIVMKNNKLIPGMSDEVIKESILCKTIMPDGRIINRDCIRLPDQDAEKADKDADKKEKSDKPEEKTSNEEPSTKKNENAKNQ